MHGSNFLQRRRGRRCAGAGRQAASAVLAAALAVLLATAAAAAPNLVPELGAWDVVVRDVPAADVQEGCAGGTQDRLLLRYDITTWNYGDSDVVFGDPGCAGCGIGADATCANPLFECSPAHGHAHFEGFFVGTLRDSQGEVIATGNKQGFCLWDNICANRTYTCSFQGLTPGCGDIYQRYLPCQYIDLTDLDFVAGDHVLSVSIDAGDEVVESDETDNTTAILVELGCGVLPDGIPCDDTDPCTTGEACGGGQCRSVSLVPVWSKLKVRRSTRGDTLRLKVRTPTANLGPFLEGGAMLIEARDGADDSLLWESLLERADFATRGGNDGVLGFPLAAAPEAAGGVVRAILRLGKAGAPARLSLRADAETLEALAAAETVDLAVRPGALAGLGCPGGLALSCAASTRGSRCLGSE